MHQLHSDRIARSHVGETEAGEPTEQPLILIANDQEWTSRAVESILAASGYRVVHAHTARDAMAVAGRMEPDLVILDQQLPDFTGPEVCSRLRQDPRFGDTLPIIITTAGPSGRPQRMTAYACGAWEFYGQPLDAEALLHKLKVYLASYREVRQLRTRVLIDGDTGLYREAGLVRRATELIAEARRMNRSVACVGWSLAASMDSEQMHRAAVAFRAAGRTADALGRLTGGEFAMVAAGTTTDGAGRLAARFQNVLSRAVDRRPEEVRVTIVAENDPALIPSTGEQLIKRLTMALAA